MGQGSTAIPITQQPAVLHEASLERIEEAEQSYSANRWGLSMYLAGLSVECMLQAHALRSGAAHDARHDLDAWLIKCSVRLQNTIRDKSDDAWARLRRMWANEMRYMSVPGLLGFLRAKGRYAYRDIKGGDNSLIKANADRLVKAARIVVDKGAVLWI